MKSVCREMDRVEKREGERMKAKAKAQDKSREIERKRKSACEWLRLLFVKNHDMKTRNEKWHVPSSRIKSTDTGRLKRDSDKENFTDNIFLFVCVQMQDYRHTYEFSHVWPWRSSLGESENYCFDVNMRDFYHYHCMPAWCVKNTFPSTDSELAAEKWTNTFVHTRFRAYVTIYLLCELSAGKLVQSKFLSLKNMFPFYIRYRRRAPVKLVDGYSFALYVNGDDWWCAE